MGMKSDLEWDVSEIFKTVWKKRNGYIVPTDQSVTLGNDAVEIRATVLYADMADSTSMVEGHAPFAAAEVYKSFLHCSAKIIQDEGGEITAYDGDRTMAVFIGDRKNTSAVRAAMKIHWAVINIINPANLKQYPSSPFRLRHVVGIDTSDLFVAKTGVRGANDLVWVGRAANLAAKLASLPPSRQTYITQEVYQRLNSEATTSFDGRHMWEAVNWDQYDRRTIYQSNFWWSLA